MAALRDALNLDGVHHVESILIDWLAMRYACYVHYGENSMKTSLNGTLAISNILRAYFYLLYSCTVVYDLSKYLDYDHGAGCDRQHHVPLG